MSRMISETRDFDSGAPLSIAGRKPMYRKQLPTVNRAGVTTQPRHAMRVEMFDDFKARWWGSQEEKSEL